MVSLALQEAYMQDPLITIRVVIFASWWKKNVPVRSLLLRSHTLAPSLHEDYGSHFRHPPKYGRLTHPGLFRTRH